MQGAKVRGRSRVRGWPVALKQVLISKTPNTKHNKLNEPDKLNECNKPIA